MIKDPDVAKGQRAFQDILQTKTIEIAALERAFAG